MTAVLDTWPDRIIASSLTLTAMSSPGNSVCSCCSSVVMAGSTTMSYCGAAIRTPDDQADRAGLLAVDEDLARLHDHRVGDLGIGDGDARDREVRGHDGRAAGRHGDALELLASGRRRDAPASARRWATCPGTGRRRSLLRAHVATEDDERQQRSATSAESPQPEEDLIGRSPRCAWHRGWLRPCRSTVSAPRPRRRVEAAWPAPTRARACPSTGAAPAAPNRPAVRTPVVVGRRRVERIAQRQHDLAFGGRQGDALAVLGRHQQRHDRRRNRLAVLRLFLVVAGAGGEHLHVADDDAGQAVLVALAFDSVTMTSTRVPGTTKPATPTTSLTLTEMARMPGGIDGGRPAPASSAASLAFGQRLVLLRRSRSRRGRRRPRPSRTCRRTCALAGHCTTLT